MPNKKVILCRIAMVLIVIFFSAGSVAGEMTSYTRTYLYKGCTFDNGESARAISLERVRRQLMEDLAGNFLTYADFKRLGLDRNGMSVLLWGMLHIEILEEDCPGKECRIKASASGDPQAISRELTALVGLAGKVRALREIRKMADVALDVLGHPGKVLAQVKATGTDAAAHFLRTARDLEAAGRLREGWSLQYCGRHQEAIAVLTETLGLHPEDASIYRFRGISRLKLGDRTRALSDFNKSLELKPALAEAYADRGLVYFLNEDYRNAIVDFDRAVELTSRPGELDPGYEAPPSRIEGAATGKGQVRESPISAYRRRAYEKLGTPKPDLAYYDAVIANNPSYAFGHYSRGRLFASSGKYDEALVDFTNAIRLQPGNAVFHAGRANVYGAIGQYGHAFEDFTRAVSLNPGFAAAFQDMGLLHMKIGANREAVADFGRVLTLDPKYPDASRNFQEAFKKVGPPRPDMLLLNSLVERNPDYAYAWYQRGVARWVLKDYPGALEDLSVAIRLRPRDGRAYLIRGILHGDMGDYERAVSDHNQAVALMPQDLTAYGQRLKAFGEDALLYDRALEDFREILRKTADARSQSAELLYRGIASGFLGLYEDALAEFRRVAALDPEYVPAYSYAGMIYDMLGNYELAAKFYGQSLQIEPEDAVALYLRAIALANLGRNGESIADLKTAAGLNLQAARDMLKKNGYGPLETTAVPKAVPK